MLFRAATAADWIQTVRWRVQLRLQKFAGASCAPTMVHMATRQATGKLTVVFEKYRCMRDAQLLFVDLVTFGLGKK